MLFTDETCRACAKQGDCSTSPLLMMPRIPRIQGNRIRLLRHGAIRLNEEGCKMGKNLRLKSARAALDLSQQDLARLVGVTRQTISAIESGDYNPTVNLCTAICRALGKTLDEIFWEGRTDE